MLELFFEYEMFAFIMVILLGLCISEDDGSEPNIVLTTITGFFMFTFIPTLLLAIFALSIYFKNKRK